MLVNVPIENQLDVASGLGLPDPNRYNNCVPTSLSAGGKALVGWNLSGGDLCDLVYGNGYTGPTDPLRYSTLLAQHGVTMQEVRGSQDVLVATAKAELAKGHPVYCAIPSLWGTVTAGQVAANLSLPTHAVMLCDASNGNLTAMNPWPIGGNAFYQTNPEAWWLAKIVYGHVIVLTRSLPVTLTRVDATTVRDSHGALLHYSIGDYALAHHSSADILHEEDYGLQHADPAHFTLFALLDDGAVLTYLNSENATREDRGAFVAQALLSKIADAEGAAAAAQAQAVQAAEAPLQAQVALLKEQLAAAQTATQTAQAAQTAAETRAAQAQQTPVGELRALFEEFFGQKAPAA